MQRADAKRKSSSDAPVWVLFAELSLRDFLSDQERRDCLAAGYLYKTVRELGMSLECIENIARHLAEFARERLRRGKQGELEFPRRIRVLCQKKMFDDANSARALQACHPEQDKKEKQIIPDSEASKIGGWGYFMIERGEDPLPDSSAISHNCIDLYLYKEGKSSG